MRCRFLAASAVLIAAAPLAASAQSISVYQAAPVRTPQQWAVLVGRDDPGSPAQDTARSVEELRDLLRARYGFPAERVRLLLGPDATQPRIMEALVRTIGGAGSSDSVLVFLGLPEVQKEGGSYLVPADAREGEPWSLLAREEVLRIFAKSAGAPALVVLPACVMRSFPNPAQRQQSAWFGDQAPFVSLLTFCGTSPDAGRAEVARELARYLDARSSSSERIPGRQVMAELGGPLRERSVIVDWLSRAADDAQEFAFSPAHDRLGTLLAQLRPGGEAEGRARVIGDIVKVALSEPDDRRREATGRAAAALVRVAADRTQPADVRTRAVQATGDLRDPAVLPALRVLYGQADAPLRKQVVDAVGRLGGAASLDLLRGALGDSDATVRIAALRAVGANHDEASFPRVLRLMRTDRSADVRLAAVQTSLLFKSRADELRAAVVPALRDPDAGVRREAAGALGSLGRDDAAPDLLAALGTETADTVREALVDALGRSSGDASRSAVEAALTPLLSSANRLPVRTSAAWALGEIHAAGAGPALVSALADPSDTMKVSAATALGALRYRPAVDPLIAMLGGGSPMAKRAAAAALGTIGDARAGDGLLAALKDDDASVSAAAAEALKRLQPTRELAGALQDRSPAVRLKAAQALAGSGGKANGPLLVGLLNDEDYEVRRVAIKALASDDLATPDNLAAVAAALDDRDVQKRVGALIVMGQVAARPSHAPLPPIDDALAASLKHPAADVRAEAVRTAGNTRNSRWLAPIVDAARDNAPHVRQAAAEALANLPSAQSVDALRRLMTDDVSDVRLAALSSLRRLNVK